MKKDKDIAKKNEKKSFFRSITKCVTPRRVVFVGILLAMAALFIVFAPKTEQTDAGGSNPEEFADIVTRVPMNSAGFFKGEPPNSAIFLSWYENSITIKEEETPKLQLEAVLYPITVKERDLSYTSSDPEVAEIDAEGNIIAKKAGSVEITVANEYTSKSAKAYLQVVQPVTGMYLEKSTINVFMTDIGVRVNAIVLPDDASNTAVNWYSKDEGIVMIDQTGHLKPVATGLTEIVATTSDGSFSSKCFVNVINQVIKVQSVSIVNKEKATIKVGDSWIGLATVEPRNAKNTIVNWTSSDPAIATVTKTGVVKGISQGTVEILAQCADGPSDKVTITVEPNPTANNNTTTNAQTYAVGGGVTYTPYTMTLDQMAAKSITAGATRDTGSGHSGTTQDVVRMYLDPNEFSSGAYKYQFMDLSKPNGISRDALNRYLAGKGVLSGQADAFIQAANTYNLSELYLVAHACVETGYGKSQLATGVSVGGTMTYNMYGIGAIDSAPLSGGSNMAYKQGWTSPAAAIIGGAKWISEHYVNATSGGRQNTLYKMRWNPENPGQHLYATDVSWATTQATILEKLFAQLPEAVISYEVPVYSGSNAAAIE